MDENRLGFSTKELARMMGTSEPFIRLEIRRGKLRAAKLGRRVVVPLRSAKEWLDAAMIGGREIK